MEGMERRGFLGQAGVVGSAVLVGCAAVSGARGRLTGRVPEPQAVSIRNEDRTARGVTVTITDPSGQTLLRDGFTVPPDSSRDAIWETRRVGRYTITAEPDTSTTVSAQINVCVGYHDAWIVLSPDDAEITGNKMYGDPDARYCTVD